MIGKIIKLTGGFYYILAEGQVFETRARGNFRHTKVDPIVGDNVEFKFEEKTLGYIEKVYPRKNMLTRPKVANVDMALVVVPVMDPKYNLVTIDKTIIQAEHQDIDVTILINKCDLDREASQELSRLYENSGFKTFMISFKDNSIEDLRNYIRGKTVALCGVSGAGKSTITSKILDRDVEVGKVSDKTRRGKHTTRHTEILFKDDIYIFDTPGFSSLSLNIDKDELKNYFREFEKYSTCKFNNCNHIKEPKCGVKEAVEAGKIERERYDNYLYIYEELKSKGDY